MKDAIPFLSLIVAALAVFVGPLVAVAVTKRQIASSLQVANKQVVAPMRQAWINNLRDLLAEILNRTVHYYTAGLDERSEDEYRQLTLLEYKIALMLNPNEEDHKRLEGLVHDVVWPRTGSIEDYDAFMTAHMALQALSRSVLKREWDRVKEKIPPT